MMYAITFASFLFFATSPALQGAVSRTVGTHEQGVTMGSLSAINSVMFTVAPVIGAPLLALVIRLPPSDWGVGITFYVSAAVQLAALVLAFRYFAFFASTRAS